MKRSIFACLLVLLVVSSAAVYADEVYVPYNQPGTGGRNSYPFNAGSYPEWTYQLCIPAKYLGGTAFTITDIAFGPSGTGTFSASPFEVRMSHSTVPVSSVFATNLPNPVVVLNAQNYKWATTDKTWSPIGLTGTFNYDGTSALTIEFRHKNGVLGGAFTGTIYYNSGYHYRVYKQGSGAYSATSGSLGGTTGLDIRITVSRAQLVPGGSAKAGSILDLNVLSPSEAGKPYQVGTSLGQGPIPIGQFKLELSADDLLVASTSGMLPTVFRKYSGLLDAKGQGQARLAIPNIPLLKGVRIYSAFLTIDPARPGAVSQVSPNVLVTIQ